MRTELDEGDREFLQRLQQQGQSSVQDMCATAGVTATAVRQRLTRLQTQGFVSRQTVRTGRGRPHHAYVLTDFGKRALGDNYGELALLLWDELQQIEEPTVRERVVNRLRDQLVRRYGANVVGGALDQRMEQLRSALQARGFCVEVAVQDNLPILRERNCPYHDLAAADPGICELEQRVFEQVLGVPLHLAQCCRNGDACCEFHPAPAGSAAVG